jgi:phenylalanyl-tRNA synthetase beta chain
MKVSTSWLEQYTAIEMEPQTLADALTMAGLEVDSVTHRYQYLDTVKVGNISEVNPHPNADRLTVCQVNMGESQRTIVCGAPNVCPGMRVPVALPGTIFPNGNLIKKSKIRGVVSQGMLCSAAELELGSDADGIWDLGESAALGAKLTEALGLDDHVFDIDLTPNRPDCLSVQGVAREVAVIQGGELKFPETIIKDEGREIDQWTSVTVEAPDHCPRYTARVIADINIGPSPEWLQDRLRSVGQRPINNMVDITNFIMLETGQPLHAFDYDQLAENRIVVKLAREGERFVTLDDKERTMNDQTLMICDGAKAVGIGGVMGGQNTEISAATRHVLLESAYFNPVSIRRTAKKLGLNTDASHRFERGVDPESTPRALDRAAQLMAELGGGRILSGSIDVYPIAQPKVTVELDVNATNRLLGTEYGTDQIRAMLDTIDFRATLLPGDSPGNDNETPRLSIDVPSYRVDVKRREDIMEEVARLGGYNQIPTTFPLIPATVRRSMEHRDLRDRLRNIMTGLGFNEAITYSFIPSNSVSRLKLVKEDARRNTVDLLNPLSEEQAAMRTSLIPGLLETTSLNLARQNRTVRMFEIGNVFIAREKDVLPRETEWLAGIWTGARALPGWHAKEEACDFFDLKGGVEALLAEIKLENIQFTQADEAHAPYLRPGHRAHIKAGEETVGYLGELHPKTGRQFNLKQAAYIFELNVECLARLIPRQIEAAPLPKYPSVARDMTLIVDRSLEARHLLEEIHKAHESLVESTQLFDVFEGEPIPAGRKSVSLRITYRSAEETLEDENVSAIHKAITARLMETFNGALPA